MILNAGLTFVESIYETLNIIVESVARYIESRDDVPALPHPDQLGDMMLRTGTYSEIIISDIDNCVLLGLTFGFSLDQFRQLLYGVSPTFERERVAL